MKRLSVVFVFGVLCALSVFAQGLQFERSQALNRTFSWDLDVGDINADGNPDVLLSDCIAFNDGHGVFTHIAHPFWGKILRLVDVDGDGDLDAVGVRSITLTVALNDGAGHYTTLPPQTGHRTNSWDVNMEVGDFTGDGRPDLATNAGDLWVNLGSGLFSEEASPRGLNVGLGMSGNRCDVTTLDADGDGRLDLFYPFTFPRGYALYMQRPDGTFVDETAARFPGLGTVLLYDACDALDINGDGATDILSNGQQGLKVLLNDGTGVFTDHLRDFFDGPYSPESYPGAWALRDLNFDGRPDLVMLGTNSRIFPGSTPRPFILHYPEAFQLLNANTCWSSVIHFVDLDGDGWEDILFRTYGGSGPNIHYFANRLPETQAGAQVTLTPDLRLALETAYMAPENLGPATFQWSLTLEGSSEVAYLLGGSFAPLDGSATLSPAGDAVLPGRYDVRVRALDSAGRVLAQAALTLLVPRDYYAEYRECGEERQTLQAQLETCDGERQALLLDAALTEAGLQEIRRLAALPPGQRRSTFVPQGSQAQIIAEVVGLLLNGSH